MKTLKINIRWDWIASIYTMFAIVMTAYGYWWLAMLIPFVLGLVSVCLALWIYGQADTVEYPPKTFD